VLKLRVYYATDYLGSYPLRLGWRARWAPDRRGDRI